MTRSSPVTALVERLRRMAKCIYIAVEPSVADDIADGLNKSAALIEQLVEALEVIADESVFNQQRFAEDSDTDYFLRCFKVVKERARTALSAARGEARK